MYLKGSVHELRKFVDHDLHCPGCELSGGIAEAFIAWAKEEGLSFWS